MQGSFLDTTKNYIDFHFTNILGHSEFYKSRICFNDNTTVNWCFSHIHSVFLLRDWKEDFMNSAVLLISSLPGWHITKIPLTESLSRASVCLFLKNCLYADPILTDLASITDRHLKATLSSPSPTQHQVKEQHFYLSVVLCWLFW